MCIILKICILRKVKKHLNILTYFCMLTILRYLLRCLYIFKLHSFLWNFISLFYFLSARSKFKKLKHFTSLCPKINLALYWKKNCNISIITSGIFNFSITLNSLHLSATILQIDDVRSMDIFPF